MFSWSPMIYSGVPRMVSFFFYAHGISIKRSWFFLSSRFHGRKEGSCTRFQPQSFRSTFNRSPLSLSRSMAWRVNSSDGGVILQDEGASVRVKIQAHPGGG